MSAEAQRMEDAAPPRSGLFAAYGAVLLFLANMFNFADRSLLGIVVEPIRRALHLNDTEISIVSGFAFSLFTCSPASPSRAGWIGGTAA